MGQLIQINMIEAVRHEANTYVPYRHTLRRWNTHRRLGQRGISDADRDWRKNSGAG